MTRTRPLQREVQTVQVVERKLGIDRPAQPLAHPLGHLASVPQPAIECRAFQQRREIRLARLVQKRLLARVAVPAIAQTGQPLGVPAVDQLLDPAHREPRHTANLGQGHPAQKKPDHLKMRTAHRVSLRPIRCLDFANRMMRQRCQPHRHASHIWWSAQTESQNLRIDQAETV